MVLINAEVIKNISVWYFTIHNSSFSRVIKLLVMLGGNNNNGDGILE
jgi:hypothetical protein